MLRLALLLLLGACSDGYTPSDRAARKEWIKNYGRDAQEHFSHVRPAFPLFFVQHSW